MKNCITLDSIPPINFKILEYNNPDIYVPVIEMKQIVATAGILLDFRKVVV